MAGDLNFKVNFDTQQAGNEVIALLQKFQAGSEAAGEKLNRALGGTTERKLVIRTVRDDTGVKQLKSELITIRSEADKLKRAFTDAVRVQPGSLTNIRQQLNEAKKARDEISQFGKVIDLTNRKAVISAEQTRQWLDADAKVKRLTDSLRNLESADKGFSGRLADSFSQFLSVGNKLQDIVTIFQSIGIAVGAITSPIKNATKALADLQAFSLAFQSIGQSSETAQAALSESSRIALGLGVSVKTVREGFQQLAPVVLNTGGSMGDVSAVTEALTSRFAAFGLSADKSRRVLNGVIQAFAKGKLQAEELTQQISEADPAFKTDLANAIKDVRDEFGNLIISTDGSVKALEAAVKSGLITADVLRRVIPALSKSELLFGKLGPTATTAVEALRKGNVTLNQVRGNFESLNQLNLESFSKLAEPIVNSFLEIEATIIDFVTTVTKLQVTKDLITIFNQVSQAISNLVKFLANGAEGFLRIVSVVSPFISAIASIPGVVELVGFALIASIIKPAKDAINIVKGLNNALSNLAKANLPGKVVNDSIPDVKQAEVSKRSLEALRKELEKPVSSGYKKEVENIINASETAETAGQKLTKGQEKRIKTLNTNLQSLTNQYSTQLAKLRQLEQSLAASQAQPAGASAANVTAINAQINALQKLREAAVAARSDAGVAVVKKQNELDAKGVTYDWRKGTDETSQAVRGLIDNFNDAKDKVSEIDGKILDLNKQLKLLGGIQIDPELTIADNLEQQIKASNTQLKVIKKDIKDTYKQISTILGTPIETKIVVPTAEINELLNLTKSYETSAIKAYANATAGSDQFIAALNTEKAALVERQQFLKTVLDNQRAIGEFNIPGMPDVRGEYEQITSALDDVDKALKQGYDGYINLARAGSDYTDGLAALTAGQKVSNQQLNAFKQAASINSIALKQSKDDLISLQNQESALIEKQKVLTSALAKPQKAGQFDILKNALKETETTLGDVQAKIKTASGAVDGFQQRADALGTVIREVSDSGKGLKGIQANFKELADSSNGVVSAIGKAGLGITKFASSAAESIKNLGKSIKALSTEVAFFAVIALAMASYSKATEAARLTQEKHKDTLDSLKSTAESLNKTLEEATGEKQAKSIDELMPKVDGISTVLMALGGIIKGIVDGLRKLFDLAAGSTIDPLTGQIKKLNVAGGQFIGIFGAAAVGALAGLVLSGFNPVGAAIGATVGLLGGLTANFLQVQMQIKRAREEFQATRLEYGKQYVQLNEIVTALGKFQGAIQNVKNEVASGKLTPEEGLAKQGSLIGQATSSYKSLLKSFQSLQAEREGVSTALDDVNARLKIQTGQLNKLRAEKDALEAKGFRSDTENQNLERLRQAYAEKTREVNKSKVASEELQQTKAELEQAEARLKARLQELTRAYPGLTEAMILTGNTASNLSEKYKQQKADLENLDPSQVGSQFDALATSMGRTKAELEAVESRAAGRELVGYIEELSSQLAAGDIPTSLDNINKLVQALEQKSVSLDINSPELPGVIQKLIEAKANAVALDGTKATITIQIIEQGLKDGTLQKTPAIIEQLKGAYEQAGKSMAVGSKEYEKNLARQKQLADQQKFDAMTIDEIKKAISDKESERNKSIEDRRHSRAMDNLKTEQDAAMKALDERKRKVETIYDAQIAALTELGPAEQQLKALQKKELEIQATKGGREGLEARAQLERMGREEKIAQLRKQKEAELKKIEEEKTKKQEEFQKKEAELLDARKKGEIEIAKIREKSIDDEIAKMSKYLSGRTKGQEGQGTGTAAKSPSAGPVVMDIKAAGPAPARQGYEDGQQYSQGYVTGVQNGPNVQAPDPGFNPAQVGAQDRTEYNQGFYNGAPAQGEGTVYFDPYAQTDFGVQGATDGTEYSNAYKSAVQQGEVKLPSSNVGDLQNKVATLENKLQSTKSAADGVSDKLNDLDKNSSGAADNVGTMKDEAETMQVSIEDVVTGFVDVQKASETTTSVLKTGMISAFDTAGTKLADVGKNLEKTFQREFTMTVNVKVNKQGLWTGGPAVGGTVYKVNELGQEGFMNKFGKVTPIQKPRFGNWRAPSDGFVIPADIFSQMNQKAPGTDIKHSKPRVGASSGSGKLGNKMLSMAFAQINGVSAAHNNLREEIAKSHAAQTLEIGKLTRAVGQLVDKDWNVDVNIKNSNNKSVAYMNALNRMI